MPRLPREESSTAIYHVMNRGVDHGPIFFAPIDRVEFLRRLEAIHERWGVEVLAYCLMTNHFHLVLRAPPGTLSKAMHHLESLFARHTNDRVGRNGPLFWQRFHSIPVEDDAYLVWVVRYVHRNPLDLPGVTVPTDHRWSSLRAILELCRAPSFLDTATVLAPFDGDVGAFAEFTGADLREAVVVRTSRDLVNIVVSALATDDLAHPLSPASRRGVVKAVLNLLDGRCRDPHIGRLIDDAVGGRTPKARQQAIRHARRRLDREPDLERVVTWVEHVLAVPGSRVPRAA